MQAKELGTLGELKFVTEALHHGFVVLQPIVDIRRFDFVLKKDDEYLKIQVKSNFRLPDSRHSFTFELSKSKKKSYSSIDVDYFAFYCDYLKSFYLVPFNMIKGKRLLRIFPFGKKNALKEYKNNWNLFR